MIYLMQILKMLNKEQRKQFVELFSDLEYELDELGWRGDETTLVNDMLFNHFGFSIEDEKQLERFTEAVLDKKKIESAFAVVNMKNNPTKENKMRRQHFTRRNPRTLKKNPVKLHHTYQPDTYYTSFQNLPIDVQEVLLNTPPRLRNSGYPMFKNVGIIRNFIDFDGRYFKAEIDLGVFDDNESHTDLLRFVDDLYATGDIQYYDVYLTEVVNMKNNPDYSQSEIIKLMENLARLTETEFDGDPKDLRLHDQTIFTESLNYTKNEYKKMENDINNFELKGSGFSVYAFCDVSGYEYWTKNMEEDNYISICVAIDKNALMEERISSREIMIAIDKARDHFSKYER